MKGAKEFTGRSLDDAIASACKYYDLPREKLEVEIVNDAKTGIFGLVGAKKATVLAKQATVKNFDFENKEEKKREQPKSFTKAPETADRPVKNKSRSLSVADQNADTQLETETEKPNQAQLFDKKDSANNAAQSEEHDRANKADRADRSGRNLRSRQHLREKRDEKDTQREGRTDRRGRRLNSNGENNANNASEPNGNVQTHARRPSDRNDRNDRRGDRGRLPREGGDSRRNDPRRQTRDRHNITPANSGNNVTYPDAEVQNHLSSEPMYAENTAYLGVQQQDFLPEGHANFTNPANQNSTWVPDSNSAMANFNTSSASQLNDDQGDDFEPDQMAQNFASLDKEKACELVKSSLDKMVAAICSDANIAVSVGEGRISASIDCGEASGLLIGREGQTLSALQYMVSRIISRQMEAAVHVHLDTGDYKERQDRKLEEISLRLANRARETGRTQYTRPLSSYHRRIVHMVLQAEEGIETRSKGEGSMKRVYIFTRSN